VKIAAFIHCLGERRIDEQAQTKRQIPGIENLVGEKSFLFPGTWKAREKPFLCVMQVRGSKAMSSSFPSWEQKLQHASVSQRWHRAFALSSRESSRSGLPNFETIETPGNRVPDPAG
jgi:hypothetical protein